jgi:hypothetical protein
MIVSQYRYNFGGLEKLACHVVNSNIAIPVKRVDEVARYPHLVTQDQFSLVSEKVSGIHEDNFAINIELFRQNVTCVELLRYKRNVELFR